MEATLDTPTETNSANSNMVLYATIDCLNKKRKFPAEQLGLPLPKHKCSSSYTSGCSSSSNANLEELYPSMRVEGPSLHYTSEPTSREDSNSLSGDVVDSVMYTCGEVKNDTWYSKVMSPDQPSTSSLTLRSNCLEKNLYSLESRSITRPSSDKLKSLYTGAEKDHFSHEFDLHSSPEYEDNLLELGSQEDYSYPDYSYPEHGTETMEPCPKELEELLYSNGVTPTNYVLSSGRWTVKQDVDQGAKKLTIDKEFEQYFSMLML